MTARLATVTSKPYTDCTPVETHEGVCQELMQMRKILQKLTEFKWEDLERRK
jgi:hypothetical protein